MAKKWNLQDIVPPDRNRKPVRRSVPTRSERSAPTETEEPPQPLEEIEVRPRRVPARRGSTPGSGLPVRKYLFGGIVLALILVFGGVATILLRGAEVVVTPKTHDTSVQASFIAKLKPAVGELGYELLSLEEVGQMQVTATGEEEVTERAEGSITIYNAYSTSPQRLIKNTRFESEEGKIYRVSDSVDIPGYTKDDGGRVIPGEATAEVFAEAAGDTYNLASGRFSVPGLKGSEQYDLIHAEVIAPGIQGGFEGMRFIVDETELAEARQKLQSELREKLSGRVKTERPNGFILYDPAITFTYEALPAEDAGNSTALIKERAHLNVPLFNEMTFASYIAKQTVSGYGGESVRLQDPLGLSFAYASDQGDLKMKESIDFALTGQARIIWNFDETSLKGALAGLEEEALPGVLSSYPAIERAEAVIRPLWKSSFPENETEIEIRETLPEA